MRYKNIKNGETIYTREFVIKQFKGFLRKLASNKSIIYKGELLEFKKYGKEVLSEMLNKYKDDKEIKHLSQRINTILETRAVKYGLGLGTTNAGKTNAAFFIFFMKNVFGWKDNNTVEHNINLPTPILANKEALKASTKKFIKAGTAYVEAEPSNDTVAKEAEV